MLKVVRYLRVLVVFISFDFCLCCDWTHSLQLDRRYSIHWTVKDEFISFKIEVEAKGYVGFGLSRNGGMAGSDMVTCWIKDGAVYCQDRHGVGNTFPPEDDINNWDVLEGLENNTHTVFVLRRKLQTCDEQDLAIDTSTLRLLYAYSNEDPQSADRLMYHKEVRGSRSVMFLQPKTPNMQSPPILHHWDILSNYSLTSNVSSIYWCTVFKGPELMEKNHIIKLEPLITPGHESYVHHITLFEVAEGNDDYWRNRMKSGYDCLDPETRMRRYNSLIVAWGVGQGDLILPANVGLPLMAKPTKYYAMEMHYDNPQAHDGIIDRSGFRLHYTPFLREFDADILMLGVKTCPKIFVPPGLNEYTVTGHSTARCMEPMPPGGLNFIAILKHGHLLAQHFKARHFRGDVELQPLGDDKYYDFNYQEFVMFPEERKFLPGDQITVECSYNSSSQKDVTYVGFSTSEEMCLAFVLYYPRINIYSSTTVYSTDVLTEAIGLQVSEKDFNVNKYFDHMKKMNWNTINTTTLEAKLRQTPQQISCLFSNGTNADLQEFVSYPKAIQAYVDEKYECKDWKKGDSNKKF